MEVDFDCLGSSEFENKTRKSKKTVTMGFCSSMRCVGKRHQTKSVVVSQSHNKNESDKCPDCGYYLIWKRVPVGKTRT